MNLPNSSNSSFSITSSSIGLIISLSSISEFVFSLILNTKPSNVCLPKGTSTLIPTLIKFSNSFGILYVKVLSIFLFESSTKTFATIKKSPTSIITLKGDFS